MAQYVKQGNIFGRLGTGIGKGLSEQVPKEIERSRLSSGLKDLGEKKNLTPFQQLAEFYSIPGAADRPQLIQSGTEFLRQQARGNALDKPHPNPFFKKTNEKLPHATGIPSITKEEPLAKIQEGYIPPTQDQIFEEAGKRFNENPQLYNNDPNKAIEAAEASAIREENIFKAYQKQHENLTGIQDNLVERLSKHAKGLGVEIPSNIYSKIEDEAIQATKPKKEGGRGLTEQQAMKDYGNKLDAISRDYKEINSIGNWGIIGRRPEDTLRSINGLQKKFEERGDTENFADKLIAETKLSPMFAYSLAEPVSKTSQLNNIIKALPKLKKVETLAETVIPKQREKTLEVIEKVANSLGKKGSPLAVAYELQKKGYDPRVWLDYLNRNRDELGLTEAQGRQIDKTINEFGTLNDWWLSTWSGLE